MGGIFIQNRVTFSKFNDYRHIFTSPNADNTLFKNKMAYKFVNNLKLYALFYYFIKLNSYFSANFNVITT